MPIKIQCGACCRPLLAPDRLAGKRVRCKCGAVVVVPDAQAEALPADLDPDTGFEAAASSMRAAESAASPPARSARRDETVCPGCLADLPKGAVLCTNCGFHLPSGRKLSLSTSTEPSRVAEAGRGTQAPAKSKKARSAGSVAAVGILMTVLKWAVVVGVVGGVAYAVHHAISFNPRQQAQDAKNKIYPGMTVQEVVDALALKPHRIVVYVEETKPGQMFSIPVEKTIGYQDNFVKNVDPKLLANGFIFLFRYTERDILNVAFDSEGKVEGSQIVDPMKPLGL